LLTTHLLNLRTTVPPGEEWEGVQQKPKPEDLPNATITLFAFG